MTQSSGDTSNVSNNIDSSNPFFLGSSDNPNSVLVSNVFNGVGFFAWKRSIIISLSAKNKLGFVDCTIDQPLESSPNYSGQLVSC